MNPLKFTFSSQICQCCAKLRKTLDKPPIITANAKESLQFCNIFGCWPIKYGLDFFLVHMYPFFSNNDQGIKFCSKIQSARNRFKSDESVGLVVVNPTQLVSSQTDVGSERYRNLFGMANRQKKDADCTVRTG
jgi:hypothetical protein